MVTHIEEITTVGADDVRAQHYGPEYQAKPGVVATVALGGYAEAVALNAARESTPDDRWLLGSEVLIRHRRPVRPGARLVVSATVVQSCGRHSRWCCHVNEGNELAALAYVDLAEVNPVRYCERWGLELNQFPIAENSREMHYSIP